MTNSPINTLRDTAQKARRLSDEHRREHRHTDPVDGSVAKRGDDLERAAQAASHALAAAEAAMRAEAVVTRREKRITEEAGLQSQLRADAQTRSMNRRKREG